jgi:type I restriction-modification system DNA methylase subunit
VVIAAMSSVLNSKSNTLIFSIILPCKPTLTEQSFLFVLACREILGQHFFCVLRRLITVINFEKYYSFPLQMGYIFEELLKRFNEARNENPSEDFTPREVIRWMVNLVLSQDQEALSHNHNMRSIYDPCCGSGGMLTKAKDRIGELNPLAEVHLLGQEVNPETYAMCKSDLYMKSLEVRDAKNIKFGSTLSNDQLADKRFDYMFNNPPYGKEWKKDEDAV